MTEHKPPAKAPKPKEAPKKEDSKTPEKKEEETKSQKSNAYYYPVNNYLYTVLQ